MSTDFMAVGGKWESTSQPVGVETALTAMCIWEALLARSESEGDVFRVLLDALGTSHIRHFTLRVLAPAAEAAWAATQEQIDEPFDWDFVPLFLRCVEPYLVSHEVANCKPLPLEEFTAIGKYILEQHQKEVG